MKVFVKSLLSIAVLCGGALAQDISGKWSGKFDFVSPNGEKKTSNAVVIITNDQGQYSATGGPTEGQQHPFLNVSFEGGVLRFDMGDHPRMRVELRLKGDRLAGQGSANVQDKVLTANWSLNRQP
jgi:hypothetical protein